MRSSSGDPWTATATPVSFEPGYVYRLTILENKVKVSGADLFDSQQQILVEPVVYEFEAFDECESKFDLNGDGVLDSGDLAQWFVEPINLNNYPEVNIDDAATLQRGINEHGD